MLVTVDGEKLRKLALEMQHDVYAIRQVSKGLNEITKDLMNDWQGSAATRFQKQIDESYIPQIEEYATILEQYQEYLKNASFLYEKLETVFSKKEIDF